MGVTPRYVRELQWKAVRALAQAMLAGARGSEPTRSDRGRASRFDTQEMPTTSTEGGDWAIQFREEMLSVQRSAPDATADVSAVAVGAAELARTLMTEQGIHVEVDAVAPDLVTMIHPSVLRQAMLASIEGLAKGMQPGKLRLSAGREGRYITITVAQCPPGADRAYEVPLVREVLRAYRGSLDIHEDGETRSLVMKLPAVTEAEGIIVLVIDDNVDLVSFYEAYTTGTRYQIAHVALGKRTFEAIDAHRPGIIVLDVMLPDIDGWELLVQLHGHPATRTIPVVVCSVVRDRELAMALGATVYVPKPVRRQQFLDALDQALSQAASGASQAAPSSAAAWQG
jgi:CheY-like chemotaxis protein